MWFWSLIKTHFKKDWIIFPSNRIWYNSLIRKYFFMVSKQWISVKLDKESSVANTGIQVVVHILEKSQEN